MKMKNDFQVDYIKEAFDKLYNRVMPYIDLEQFADADTAFKELDKKVHSEIYILKKCLDERDRAVKAGLTRSEVLQERISDLEQRLNDECKHGEDLADINGQLASENADLKTKFTFLENSRTAWRSRAQHAEKAVTDLNKKVNDLEKENANLRVTPPDANAIKVLEKENSKLNTKCKSYWKDLFEARADVTRYKKLFMEHFKENERLREVIDGKEKEIDNLKKKIQDLEEENASLDEDVDALVAENADLQARISSIEKSNSILRGDNETLFARLDAADIFKRPWHGDGNAMTGECSKELKAEKARLEEKVDLSYGHDFKFGDEVFVPWSCEPYMYVIRGRLYNPRTENLVYISGTEHLKWFGDKFSIV